MASFSQVEQITNMAAANQSIATNLSSSSAVEPHRPHRHLHGQLTTSSHTGTVESVTVTDGKPSLTVAGDRRDRSLDHHAGRLGDE